MKFCIGLPNVGMLGHLLKLKRDFIYFTIVNQAEDWPKVDDCFKKLFYREYNKLVRARK